MNILIVMCHNGTAAAAGSVVLSYSIARTTTESRVFIFTNNNYFDDGATRAISKTIIILLLWHEVKLRKNNSTVYTHNSTPPTEGRYSKFSFFGSGRTNACPPTRATAPQPLRGYVASVVYKRRDHSTKSGATTVCFFH